MSQEPILNAEDDALNREVYVQSLYDYIKRENFSGGTQVISVQGGWGSGKSSILNLLQLELEKGDSKNDKPPYKVIRSSLWGINHNVWYESHFFLQILKHYELKLSNEFISVSSYFFGLIPKIKTCVPPEYRITFEVIQHLIKAIESAERKNIDTQIQALFEQKKSIRKFLSAAKIQPPVIFLDDLDRLDGEELRNFLRIIKHNLDFTQCIFVLAYDEKIVAQLLEKEGLDGRDFMEKIINLPTDVPVLEGENQKNFLRTTLRDSLSDFVEFSYDNTDKWEIKFKDLVETLYAFAPFVLNTPRSIIRFGEKLKYIFKNLGNNIEFDELVLIEFVRMFYPDVWTRFLHCKHKKSYKHDITLLNFDAVIFDKMEHIFNAKVVVNSSMVMGNRSDEKKYEINDRELKLLHELIFVKVFQFEPVNSSYGRLAVRVECDETQLCHKETWNYYLQFGTPAVTYSKDEIMI